MNMDDIRKNLDDFMPYSVDYIERFELSTSFINSYKVEKVGDDIFYIELIFENATRDKLLILQNIWYVKSKNVLLFPSILNGVNKSTVNLIMNVFTMIINNISVAFSGNLLFFTSSLENLMDLKTNEYTYSWENGVLVSPYIRFVPLLKIVNRYLFLERIISKQDIVIEAASGFGYGAAYISRLARKVYGIDISSRAIEFSKKAYPFSNVEWRVGDVTNLQQFSNNSIDVYVSYETIEHIPIDLVDSYLSEAKRVLKKNGKFVLSTPNKAVRSNIKNPFHIKEYYFEELDSLLNKYFDLIEYFSVMDNFQIEKGERKNAQNFIAVCHK